MTPAVHYEAVDPTTREAAAGTTVLQAAYLPNPLPDEQLAEQSYVPEVGADVMARFDARWEATKDWKWHTELQKLSSWQLDPGVVAVLRHVFPPSSHACTGLDEAVRTCHFHRVVAYQSKFYYVSDAPHAGQEREIFTWLLNTPQAKQPAQFIHHVTYA